MSNQLFPCPYDSRPEPNNQAQREKTSHYKNDTNRCASSPKWSQQKPSIKTAKQPTLWVNDKPCKHRNWRDSRQAHRNLAGKWARCLQYRLNELNETHLIFTGSMKMPNASPDAWKQFKKRMNELRCRAKLPTSFVAKQHITTNRHSTSSDDDMHFDFIAIAIVETGNLSQAEQQAKEQILRWIDLAGGNRRQSSCVIVHNRGESNLENITNYLFKYYPDGHPKLKDWNRRFFLPSTNFPVTWVSGKVWGRTTAEIEDTYYFNGTPTQEVRKRSPFEQIWKEFIATFTNNKEIQRLETKDYRQRKSQAAYEAIFNIENEVDEIMKEGERSDPTNRSDINNEPRTLSAGLVVDISGTQKSHQTIHPSQPAFLTTLATNYCSRQTVRHRNGCQHSIAARCQLERPNILNAQHSAIRGQVGEILAKHADCFPKIQETSLVFPLGIL
jgi:hypothetical protein